MIQTRAESLIESMLSTAVGFGVGLVAQIVVFPWFGMDVTFEQNIGIAAIFTGVSVARGYVMRRFGQRWITKAARHHWSTL